MAKVAYLSDFEKPLANYKPTAANSFGRFRKWHVEPLLNQAADLLDRCARDRKEYYDLTAKWKLLNIEREQEIKQLNAQDAQIQAGMIELEYKKLTEDLKAENDLTAQYKKVFDHFRNWYSPQEPPSADQAAGILYQAEIAKSLYATGRSVKEIQKQWEDQNRQHRIDIINAIKDARQSKNQSMDGPEGELNFEAQMIPLRAKIQKDFEDAVDRVHVAYEGLNQFYAYETQAGVRPPPRNDPADGNPIDVNVQWVRDAIRWLIAFGQLDQGWSSIYSLRSLIGDEKWQQLMRGAAPVTLVFNLPRDDFSTHSFVRLRGLSVFVSHELKSLLPWRAAVLVPRTAVAFQITGDPPINRYMAVEQTELPKCHIGRVETRTSVRLPEVAGQISLMNASPIGTDDANGAWKLDLFPPRGVGVDFSQINDVELELNMLGRPM